MTQTTLNSAAELTLQIETLERQASRKRETMQYADGQAYRDEQRVLSGLQQKIATLKKQLSDCQE